MAGILAAFVANIPEMALERLRGPVGSIDVGRSNGTQFEHLDKSLGIFEIGKTVFRRDIEKRADDPDGQRIGEHPYQVCAAMVDEFVDQPVGFTLGQTAQFGGPSYAERLADERAGECARAGSSAA